MSITADQQHTLEWSDRLQDWLDGDCDASARDTIEAHLASCKRCSAQVEALRALDLELRSAAPRIALDESFDKALFAQIDALDESKRAAARRLVEEELRQNLSALSRSWKRTLSFVLPGVVGGVALAFVVSTSFFSADIAQPIVAGAQNLTHGDASIVQSMLTALLGAGVGAGVARWLASVAD